MVMRLTSPSDTPRFIPRLNIRVASAGQLHQAPLVRGDAIFTARPASRQRFVHHRPAVPVAAVALTCPPHPLLQRPIAMSDDALPDFDELADVLDASGALASPAELQGQLCGQLAAGQVLTRVQWLSGLAQQCDLQQSLSDADRELLGALYDYSAAALAAADFAWRLALPADDTPLHVRVEALAGWCQGFLVGAGLVRGHTPSAEFGEVLEDFAAIAQAGDDDGGDDAEEAFFELGEYVRLAVLNAYLTTHGQGTDASPEAGAEASVAGTPADLFKRRLH